MAKALPVRWTPRAVGDLDAIHEHIANDRPMVAKRMKARLVEAADSLGLFPERGREAGASRELVVVNPYVIRYRIRPEAVVILRVKHGAQRR